MSIRHYEIVGSQDGSDATDKSSQQDLRWIVTGTDVISDLKAYLDPIVPGFNAGLKYRSLTWKHLGPQVFEATAHYVETQRESEDKQETGSFKFNFDTTGGTQKVTYGEIVGSWTANGTPAPDLQGAINVNAQGKPQGVDITIPMLKFDIVKRQPKATITLAYVNTLYKLTGKVNAEPFQGFAAGEVLFLGATGGQASDADPDVTYKFACSENVTNLTVGPITIASKKGHDYLALLWSEETSNGALVPRPEAAYAHRLYKPGDFGLLGI